jgi:hypothetical protein
MMLLFRQHHFPDLDRKVRGPPLWRASAFMGSGLGNSFALAPRIARGGHELAMNCNALPATARFVSKRDKS